MRVWLGTGETESRNIVGEFVFEHDKCKYKLEASGDNVKLIALGGAIRVDKVKQDEIRFWTSKNLSNSLSNTCGEK